jgi:formylglycine-generating enzyme required for sulfatase activity
MADLGVEDGRAAHRAEPEQELRALIADAEVFRGVAEDFERRREAGESSEDTAGASLAGEAVTHADAARLAFDLETQLAAGARSGSGNHRVILTRHARLGKIAFMTRVLLLMMVIAVAGCASTDVRKVTRDCEHCPEMVVIPAGTAILGAGADDKFRNADELPERRFTLREPFAVSRYEITREQYAGTPPVETNCAKRLVKGGSWGTLAHNVRIAERLPYAAPHRDDSIGIRVAKTLR